jgi:hypothetical protein
MTAEVIDLVPELGEKPSRKIGETVYTDDLAEKICARLAAGESLNRICKDEGMPAESTVRLWEKTDFRGFAAKYASARDFGIDHQVEGVIDLADDESIPVESRRIRVDARKWAISKMAPKKYGDRIQHEHSGGVIAGTIVIGASTAPKVIEGRADVSHTLPKPDASDDGAE